MTPSSITLDGKGNIFGMTVDGGGYSCTGGGQCGTVFELSPNSSGGWTKTTLHAFTGGLDGGRPGSSLMIDASGNLFGTTIIGGVTSSSCSAGCGVVFEMSPSSSGTWTFTALYSFDFTHGSLPSGTLARDAAGNIYGTADEGARTESTCPFGCGVVFELSPTATGWKQSLVHSFSGPDGGNPVDGVVLDAKGNVFGTATIGGGGPCQSGYAVGCGVVFEISPASGGHWTYDRLYAFHGSDGNYPASNPLFESSGQIIGTTVEGGGGYGNFYELVPSH